VLASLEVSLLVRSEMYGYDEMIKQDKSQACVLNHALCKWCIVVKLSMRVFVSDFQAIILHRPSNKSLIANSHANKKQVDYFAFPLVIKREDLNKVDQQKLKPQQTLNSTGSNSSSNKKHQQQSKVANSRSSSHSNYPYEVMYGIGDIMRVAIAASLITMGSSQALLPTQVISDMVNLEYLSNPSLKESSEHMNYHLNWNILHARYNFSSQGTRSSLPTQCSVFDHLFAYAVSVFILIGILLAITLLGYLWTAQFSSLLFWFLKWVMRILDNFQSSMIAFCILGITGSCTDENSYLVSILIAAFYMIYFVLAYGSLLNNKTDENTCLCVIQKLTSETLLENIKSAPNKVKAVITTWKLIKQLALVALYLMDTSQGWYTLVIAILCELAYTVFQTTTLRYSSDKLTTSLQLLVSLLHAAHFYLELEVRARSPHTVDLTSLDTRSSTVVFTLYCISLVLSFYLVMGRLSQWNNEPFENIVKQMIDQRKEDGAARGRSGLKACSGGSVLPGEEIEMEGDED
jgi:hypothetical protein